MSAPKNDPKSDIYSVRRVNLERRQKLEHRLRSNPSDAEGFLELGAIYREEDRPLEAKRVLERAAKIFPEDPKVLWEYEEAVLARSLQQYREVRDLDARLNTAETERELKRSTHDWIHRRIDVCKARLKRDPSLKHLHIVAAEALLEASDPKSAIEYVKPILNDDELSPQGYLIQGRGYLDLNKEVEAMASLRACALRRAVPAPAKLKILALRLLCSTAERQGVQLTLERYRQLLELAEQQVANA